MDNYDYTKHISSWARGVANISNRAQSGVVEVSPVKVNFGAKKFSVSANPAYAVYHDFKNNKTTMGINSIVQVNYNLKNNGKIFFEANYQSIPGKSLSDIRFGNIPRNTSYMLSCMYPL